MSFQARTRHGSHQRRKPFQTFAFVASLIYDASEPRIATASVPIARHVIGLAREKAGYYVSLTLFTCTLMADIPCSDKSFPIASSSSPRPEKPKESRPGFYEHQERRFTPTLHTPRLSFDHTVLASQPT
jgi:hypothetical protein